MREEPGDSAIFTNGIDLIIYSIKNKRQLLRVYECFTPEDAKKIILNPNVKNLWIFGHGDVDTLDFGKNGILHYWIFKDIEKKDLIGQFHCNTTASKGYPSLADFILKPNGKKIVPPGFRCPHQNRILIQYCIDHDWNCYIETQ